MSLFIWVLWRVYLYFFAHQVWPGLTFSKSDHFGQIPCDFAETWMCWMIEKCLFCQNNNKKIIVLNLLKKRVKITFLILTLFTYMAWMCRKPRRSPWRRWLRRIWEWRRPRGSRWSAWRTRPCARQAPSYPTWTRS